MGESAEGFEVDFYIVIAFQYCHGTVDNLVLRQIVVEIAAAFEIFNQAPPKLYDLFDAFVL